jgi:iron-sulfur cluster assembly protein
MATGIQAEAIVLTATAVEAVRGELSKHAMEGKPLRLFVDPGGWSGYRYGMSPATQVHESDRLFDYQEGVRIVIDPESFSFLRGSTIDFTSDSLGGDFHISNPNAVWSCGCGKSFRTADMPEEAHASGECRGG